MTVRDINLYEIPVDEIDRLDRSALTRSELMTVCRGYYDLSVNFVEAVYIACKV